MSSERLLFYRADPSYCEFLRSVDKNVPYAWGEKEKRPFIGVLLEIKEMRYFAPLYSPKPRHLKIRDSALDCIKIDGGQLGVINYNNMIPIHDRCLARVETRFLPSDSEEDRKYKILLGKQLDWCNDVRDEIRERAVKLYEIVCRGHASPGLAKRCCNFPVLEKEYRRYCLEHNLVTGESISNEERIAAAQETAACRGISAKERSKDERSR